MKPGPELDALVAQHVMGLDVVDMAWPCAYNPETGELEAILQTEAEKGWPRKKHPYPVYADKDSSGFFGWPPDKDGHACIDPVPAYSTDWRCAEKVVDKIAIDYTLEIKRTSFGWHVELTPEYMASGETMPHAICLAALKMKGVKV